MSFMRTPRHRILLAAMVAGISMSIAQAGPAAADDTAGAGTLAAGITYTTGAISPLAVTCSLTQWDVSNGGSSGFGSTGGFVDLSGVDNAGPMTVSGSTFVSPDCGWEATAQLSLTISSGSPGVAGDGSFSCSTQGGLSRVGVIAEFTAGGPDCTVNGASTPGVALVSAGVFQPSGGLTQPSTTATYTGPWVLTGETAIP